MNYDELIKMSEDEINEYFWKHHSEWASDEAKYHRLMWGMCRDNYDKALMMDYWEYRTAANREDLSYQNHIMNAYCILVSSYMNNPPTWEDAPEWTGIPKGEDCPDWVDNHLEY